MHFAITPLKQVSRLSVMRSWCAPGCRMPPGLNFGIQPVYLDLRAGPGTLELNAGWSLAWEGALYEAYFSPARADVEMVYNLILCHALS
jgi:hypothetical protein